MEISKIAAMYEVEDHEIKKVLQPAGFEYGTTELSIKELAVFDEAWTLIKIEGKSNKEVKQIMQQRAEQAAPTGISIPLELDPSFQAILDEQAKKIAQKYADSSPEVIKQQQELANQYLVKRFWDNVRALSESGELEQSFDRVFGSDNPAVIEAKVLPGESPALPESSTSGS